MKMADDNWNVSMWVKKVKREEYLYPEKGLAAYGYNNLIIITCSILFLLERVFPNFIVNYLVLWPSKVLYMPWQLVTAIFLHDGFSHYIYNMIPLLYFGNELEKRVGGKRYLMIFFVSGIVGNLGYIAFCYATHSFNPALGASGAIYGVMAALAIIAPETKTVLLPILIPIDITATFALIVACNLMLFYTTRINYTGHLAGMLAGLYSGYRASKNLHVKTAE